MDSDELLATFKQLDIHGKGTIDADDFMKALAIFGGADAFDAKEEKDLRVEMGLPVSGGEFDYARFIQLRNCLADRKMK